MTDPFLMEPPCFLSVSGGRTSMYMLRRILDAHGGTLPSGVEAVFCSTGKEHPGTLDFVQRCSVEWGCPITWLEFRWEPGRFFYAVVDHATASRQGEPFDQLITAKRALPNQVKRICTIQMKIYTLHRYAKDRFGGVYRTALGLRADEPDRVAGIKAGTKVERRLGLFGWDDVVLESDRDGREIPVFPLFDAAITKADIAEFWGGGQPFDLDVPPGCGNCTLCFLKGAGTLLENIRRDPESARWWIEKEALVLGVKNPQRRVFNNTKPSYQELYDIATGKVPEPGWVAQDRGPTGACGELIECRCTD